VYKPTKQPKGKTYIKSFWSALGQKDFANNWETKKYEQLVDRIKLKLKVFDTFTNPNETNLRKKANGGVLCGI